MVTAGLTGGIASGKTMVAQIFRELGARIIDADEIARQVVEPGSVGFERIKAYFGDGMLTSEGRLDRALIAAEVFSDALEKEGIPVIVRSFSETSFDGIFIPQKGWGLILVPKEFCDRARQIILSVETSLPSQSDQ